MAVLTGRAANARAFLGARVLVVASCLFGASISLAQAPQASEYQAKAAFVVNFPKYVDWPAEAFAATNSPIVIAVLGETRAAEEIQKAIAGRTVNGRSFAVKRLAAGEDSGVCHIRFISATERQWYPNLPAKLKDAGVLTVGESDDFLGRGGIINLALRDQRIALEVNVTAADQAGIRISSKLLGVASVVKGKAK